MKGFSHRGLVLFVLLIAGIAAPGSAYPQAAPETAGPSTGWRGGRHGHPRRPGGQESPGQRDRHHADDIQKSGATSVPEVLTGLWHERHQLQRQCLPVHRGHAGLRHRGRLPSTRGHARRQAPEPSRHRRPNWLEILSRRSSGSRSCGSQQRPLRDSAIAGSINIITSGARERRRGIDLHRRKLNTTTAAPAFGLGRQGLLRAQRRGLTSSGLPDRSKFTTE